MEVHWLLWAPRDGKKKGVMGLAQISEGNFTSSMGLHG